MGLASLGEIIHLSLVCKSCIVKIYLTNKWTPLINSFTNNVLVRHFSEILKILKIHCDLHTKQIYFLKSP